MDDRFDIHAIDIESYADECPAAFFAAGGTLVADYVATAATGIDVNDALEVTGPSYRDNGCGSDCLPPQDTVVWSGDQRLLLPTVPGLSGITVRAIAPDGTVVGLAGFIGTTTHAVVWEIVGGSYVANDIGNLPGKTISDAIGMDDAGRVVGWSTTTGFPPDGSPFVWTEADGMVDLSALGFPDEIPLAISPGGMVATADHWYSLDDPGSVETVPPAPQNFAVGTFPTAINDFGEQARFLVNVNSGSVFLYRLHADGDWNQISPIGTGSLTTYGMGSIGPGGTITATVAGQGMIAFGPDGPAEPVEDLVASTYGGGDVTRAGPQNNGQDFVADLMIGLSPRVVILSPAEPCVSDCLMARTIKMNATFVDEPGNPGQCTDLASSEIKIRVTVVDETGDAVQGAQVKGRFLDEYWTDLAVTGTTNNKGEAQWIRTLPPCVGTTAFVVDDVVLAGRTFDRTRGTLVASMIPQ
jgi:hypothetical protein